MWELEDDMEYSVSTEKLKKDSLGTKPSLSVERASLYCDIYKKLSGQVSIPVLRAKAFFHFMNNRKLYLAPGELIAGEKGAQPQAAPVFPELTIYTEEDFDVISGRDEVGFDINDGDRNFYTETIAPYFNGSTMRDRIFGKMSSEWKACYNAGIFTEFMEQRGPGHTVAGDKIYKKGLEEIKSDILESMKQHEDDPEALEELKAMEICCDAVISYGKRYGDMAAEAAEKETDPHLRSIYTAISENCKVVPQHAPRTFHQAVQMYWFVHVGVTTELNIWDAFSPGRLDQHLIAFYRKDLENGTIDEDAAKEILKHLWIKFHNQPAPPKVGITMKESSTYTDFANINTGGVTPHGDDGVNEVSYMILDVMDEMRLVQPNSNVQISGKTPDEFLLKACRIAAKGWGQPAFYNTEAIIQELINAGKSPEDARLGGASGCVETGCFGHEAYILTGYMNLSKILEITLHNGIDPVTGKTIGIKTGDPAEFDTFDALLDAYKRQMDHFIGIKVAGSNIIEDLYSRYMPVPFLSLIIEDCVSNAKDYNAGGARYNVNYIQGVGIGNVADALTAVKYNVFDKKKFTLKELVEVTADDFENADRIYDLVTEHTPKYGNDDDYADEIMSRAFMIFYDSVTGRPAVRGGEYRINMLPTTCHVYFGSVTGATCDGRRAFKPLPDGISPSKNADRNGPTAVLVSASKMDHLITGGTLLNQKFTPGNMKDERSIKNLAALIRGYFRLNGHHIQFNVVDRETLLDARKNPRDHKDLIVRVAGYSDYFNNLNRNLQDEIIARTEQEI